MDNRRPSGSDPDKPYNREINYKKDGENSYGQKTYPPRDNRFQSNDARGGGSDRYAPRRNDEGYPARNDKSQPGDNRFQPRDNPRFQARNNQTRDERPRSFQPRDNQPRDSRDNQPRVNQPREAQSRDGQPRGYQSRDNQSRNNQSRDFQPRTDRFQPRGESFQSRDEKVQPRVNNFQSRDNKFQPRDSNFQPRNDRFQPRDAGVRSSNSGFERRDGQTENRFDNRGDKFQPRRNFVPRGSGGARPAPAWKTMERPRIYDEMQITDGKHVGKLLKKNDSPKMRPTAQRVREAMFKLIFRRVRAGRFLDLCAGGGTVGIEAISRGALICSFVERSAKMCGIIKKNLETVGIKQGHGEVFEIEAAPFLKQMAKRRRLWDVVFFDPPYDTDYDEVLSYLSRGVAIRQQGALVIEHHSEMFFPERLGVLERRRVITLGETTLSFYERK